MPYDAKAVANYFLDLAEASGERLSPMKLQKLVYYAHGWNLGLTGRPLLDEEVQAWSFGPVIRSLYNEFREFKADAITRKAEEYECDQDGEILARQPRLDDYPDGDAEFTRKLLRRIWDVYRGFSAVQLSNLTHAPGTPWDRVCRTYGGQIPKYAVIPEPWIKEHFEAQGTPG